MSPCRGSDASIGGSGSRPRAGWGPCGKEMGSGLACRAPSGRLSHTSQGMLPEGAGPGPQQMQMRRRAGHPGHRCFRSGGGGLAPPADTTPARPACSPPDSGSGGGEHSRYPIRVRSADGDRSIRIVCSGSLGGEGVSCAAGNTWPRSTRRARGARTKWPAFGRPQRLGSGGETSL